MNRNVQEFFPDKPSLIQSNTSLENSICAALSWFLLTNRRDIELKSRTLPQITRTDRPVPGCEALLQRHDGVRHSHCARLGCPRHNALGRIHDPVSVEAELHAGQGQLPNQLCGQSKFLVSLNKPEQSKLLKCYRSLEGKLLRYLPKYETLADLLCLFFPSCSSWRFYATGLTVVWFQHPDV